MYVFVLRFLYFREKMKECLIPFDIYMYVFELRCKYLIKNLGSYSLVRDVIYGRPFTCSIPQESSSFRTVIVNISF